MKNTLPVAIAFIVFAANLIAAPLFDLEMAGKHAQDVTTPSNFPAKQDAAYTVYDWPTLGTPRIWSGIVQFGGTPVAHSDAGIDQIAYNAAKRIAKKIDASYDGLIVLDQESMAFDFESCERWHYQEYKLTLELVRDKHYAGQSLDDPKMLHNVKATARSIYNNRARRLTLAYIRAVRSKLPNARIGYYGATTYGLDHDTAVAIFSEVDAICPRVYFHGNIKTESDARKLIKTRMSRAKAASKAGGNKPIFVFVSGGVNAGFPLLSDEAIHWQMTMPIEMGASGLIYWHGIHTKDHAATLSAGFAASIGNALHAAQKACTPTATTELDTLQKRIDELTDTIQQANTEIDSSKQRAIEIAKLRDERDKLTPYAGVAERIQKIDTALLTHGVRADPPPKPSPGLRGDQ